MSYIEHGQHDLRQMILDGQIPALPQTAIRLLELANDPTKGPMEVARPIVADPGLAGQVLRFVNSSYFGFSHEVATVPRAISLVGVHTIKNFALWSAVFSLMPESSINGFDLKRLWQDSLRRALFARRVAKILKAPDPELVFSAALLQDLALPLVMKVRADMYYVLLRSRAEGHHRLSALERQAMGSDHAQLGGVICRYWNLPEAFAVLVEHHTEIDACARQAARVPDRAAVALSALLPCAADDHWHEFEPFMAHWGRMLPASAPPPADLLCETDTAFTEFAPVLQMGTSIPTLHAIYTESVSRKMAAQPQSATP